MSLVLPNANELRKVSEQVRDSIRREWVESLKQNVIDSAKVGVTSTFLEDPYDGKYEDEIRNLFEPLGYKVEVIKDHFYGNSGFQINW